MDNDRVSLSDAAKILGVARVTAWRWAKDGKLKAKKIGGRAYTTHAAIKEFQESHIVDMADHPPKKTGSPYAVVTG